MFGSFPKLSFCLCLLLSVTAARAADVVRTTVAGDGAEGDPPDPRTEIVQVVFEPGEEATARAIVRDQVGDAVQSNPHAIVDVVCQQGGAMTAGDCNEHRRDLEENERRTQIGFEVVRQRPAAAAATAPRGSDWKGVLTFIRTVSSGVTVGVTAMLSKGADWHQALVVGATAGAWSGLMQWKNRARLNWQANAGWLSTAPPEPHERAGLVKRYLKRAIQTGAYGALMTAAFYFSGLNPDVVSPDAAMRLLTMTGESLYTQTAWEALNQEWTEAAIRRNPERAHVYKRLSGIGSLVQATLNVMTNALNIGGVHVAGVHLGTAISGTIGTLGTLTYLYRYLPEAVRRPIGRAARAVGNTAMATCRLMFRMFGW